jgi:copper chaperone NosL
MLAGGALLCLACSSGVAKPVPVDTRNDACASCRMAVSDPKLAAELVAPGEEPRIFDDIGCLAAYLRQHPAAPDAAIYAADHRTGAWIPARAALFTRVASIETPMGSHLVAHADQASREADGVTGAAVGAADLLGGTK